MIENYIDTHKDEIIKQVQSLIQIPSVYSKSDNPKKPFGENCNLALEYMLNLGEKLGFRTKNLDGYCGYIEFGEGEEMLGIIGHLDVVPEGEGWSNPPFSATIKDNKIFGRGAIDDKGPVISSLYAMKAVMENFKVNKRVRLILGLNEENSWLCMKHYKEVEEMPTLGFSPDADFPCIYAEKSILDCCISMAYNKNENIKIKEIDCKNNASNVVAKFCSVTLEVTNDIEKVIEKLENSIKKFNFNITVEKPNQSEIKLTSYGIQAHAAHPDLGTNAISRLILVLNEVIENELLEFFCEKIGTEFNGKSLGIACNDESGELTLNVGSFALVDNELKIRFNLRIPIHTSIEDVESKFKEAIATYSSINYHTNSKMPHLYVSKEDKLIKTLCKIYSEVTNTPATPIAIGGATYARAFKNCVSFGPNFPGNKDMCHQTDEFIDIDSLILSCKIYAKAIIELTS